MEYIDKIIDKIFDKCKLINKIKNGVEIALYDDSIIKIMFENNNFTLEYEENKFYFKNWETVVTLINDIGDF